MEILLSVQFCPRPACPSACQHHNSAHQSSLSHVFKAALSTMWCESLMQPCVVWKGWTTMVRFLTSPNEQFLNIHTKNAVFPLFSLLPCLSLVITQRNPTFYSSNDIHVRPCFINHLCLWTIMHRHQPRLSALSLHLGWSFVFWAQNKGLPSVALKHIPSFGFLSGSAYLYLRP